MKTEENNGNKSLSKKIEELEQATDWFYSDDFKLDEAAKKYEETVKMAKEIEGDLENLKNKIEIVEKDFTKD